MVTVVCCQSKSSHRRPSASLTRSPRHDIAKLIRRQHHRLFSSPGDVLDLHDLNGVPALKWQILPQRGQIKELVHQTAQVSFAQRCQIERLEPCVNLRWPYL